MSPLIGPFSFHWTVNKLDIPVRRKLLAALVAVFLVAAYQPTAYADESQSIGMSVVDNSVDYYSKPLITSTVVTPEPAKEVIKVSKKAKSIQSYTSLYPSSVTTSNGYTRGYCTAYVASIRTDLPGNLGDARYWLSRAVSDGLSTGRKPEVGSVVQTSESKWGHVAIVIAIDEDQITIREMNYVHWNVISTRVISVNSPTIRGFIY